VTEPDATAGAPADSGKPPAYAAELLRHFADLRDLQHGDAISREGKEELFRAAVQLLHPHAVGVLNELDEHVMLGTGDVVASGLLRLQDGGVGAEWTLSWPEQREADIAPVTLLAFYGAGFHHPHLRGATVGDWPLNLFDAGQAAAAVPTLRAIAAADLHNLVFQRDYRIVPAITAHPARLGLGFVR
jgi:hypothetical protein